jgi:hypothetical protein
VNCQRQGESCDYSIRLNWDGRSKRKDDEKPGSHLITFTSLQSFPRQPAQATSAKGANGHGSRSNSCARPFASSASLFVIQDYGSGFQPPFGQLNDRRERIPPSSAQSSTPRCRRPQSVASDHPPYPPSNDIPSRDLGAAQSISTLPQLQHFHQPADPPPSIASTFDTPTRRRAAPLSGASQVMPPPYALSSPIKITEFDAPIERSAKRVRLSPRDDMRQIHEGIGQHQTLSHSPDGIDGLPGPPCQPLTPVMVSSRMSNPMTPASSSSTNSDEARQIWRPASNSYSMQDHYSRRVSVGSLLLDSSGMQPTRMTVGDPAQVYADQTALSPFLELRPPSRQRAHPNTQMESYGLDRGHADLDIPKNNDIAAIDGDSPSQLSEPDSWLESVELVVPEFGFGLPKREFVFAKGGYYASPVPITIPRMLEPLPSILLHHPMNLLYFHHFLNHTARILVVHDCSQNPFRTILPQSRLLSYPHNVNIGHANGQQWQSKTILSSTCFLHTQHHIVPDF